MNIPHNNPTTILCYGDSNTYGQRPDAKKRFNFDIRWTRVLQNLLGDNYQIIEEGLPSRTTDLEYVKKPGRNGRQLFRPIIESHNPLDVIVLMLGTNDLKEEYSRDAPAITSALKALIDDSKAYARTEEDTVPRIIIVSPIPIDADKASIMPNSPYTLRSEKVSNELAEMFRKLALRENVEFVDGSIFAQYIGEDGVHWQPEAHKQFAEKLAEVIRGLYN